MTQSKKIADLIVESRQALNNALNAPDIMAALQPYGYDAAKLAEGQALVQALDMAHAAQGMGKAGQKAATAAFQDTWKAARQLYGQHVKMARLLLETMPAYKEQLGLMGSRAQAFNAWLIQARRFYREALADSNILAILAGGGLTQVVLEENQARLETVAQANNEQEAAKGRAQQSTQDRDAAAQPVRVWMRDFYRIARMALADKPQLLEGLGKVVKS